MPTPDAPGAPGAPAAASRPRWPAAVAGAVVSAVLLWWSARGVSFSALGEHLRTAKLLPLGLGVLFATLGFPLRIPRWRLLLRDAAVTAGVERPATAPLWHAIAIGFAGNNLLPFRAGEVLRVLLGARLTGIGVPAVVSSIAIERILDGITVLVLLGLGLVLAHLPPDLTVANVNIGQAATSFGLIMVVGVAGALTLVMRPAWIEAIVRRVLPFPRVADPLLRIARGLADGLSALRSPGRFASALGWSFALWLLNAFGYYVAFRAFGIEVNYAGALVMQGILLIGIAAPSTPGYVGVFEAAITASLALFGVRNDAALAYAVAFHVISFFPITLLGFWSLTRVPFSLGALRAEAPPA